MQLHMIEPMEARNDVVFLLEPQGDTTRVTWAMEGRSSYLAKLIQLFVSMDRMVGGDFEAGLANLKAACMQVVTVFPRDEFRAKVYGPVKADYVAKFGSTLVDAIEKTPD